jgi:hypothetical protein
MIFLTDSLQQSGLRVCIRNGYLLGETMRSKGQDPNDVLIPGNFVHIGFHNHDGTPKPALEL